MGELQSVSKRQRQVWGTDCDVTKPYSVTRLASLAQGHFPGGKVDVWINNAGALIESRLHSVFMFVAL